MAYDSLLWMSRAMEGKVANTEVWDKPYSFGFFFRAVHCENALSFSWKLDIRLSYSFEMSLNSNFDNGFEMAIPN